MILFLDLNDVEWEPPPRDEDGEVTDAVIRDFTTRPLDDEAVVALSMWVRDRTGQL